MALYIGNTRYCPVIGKAETLPYDAEIEWLGVRQGVWSKQSDYIPTGRGISIDMVATFISYPTSANYVQWFIAKTDQYHCQYKFMRGTANNATMINMVNTEANSVTLTYSYSSNTTYHLLLDDLQAHVQPVGGTIYSATINTTHTGTENTSGFQIGDNHPSGGIELNVQSFTVRNYGTVVLDYIPVRVGQVGYFYDKISGNLYGKATECTSDFVLGQDIT
jgi:hypothetical protein